MRRLGLFTLLALASYSDAAAQVLPLHRGQRVRVTAPAFGLVKQPASFEAQHGDTIVVIADSATHLPLASVSRLDRYGGRKSGWAVGLGVGAAVGTVVGLGLAAAEADDGSGFIGPEAVIAAGGAVGAVSGALVGLIIGGLIKSDKWNEVPLDAWRVHVVAQRDGFGIGASIPF